MIDFHVHVYPPEIIQSAEEISKTEPYFNALIHNKVHRWATVEDLIMNDSAVKRSVIFGFAFRDLGLCRICNDYVISSVKNYPERFSGLCVVPPLAKRAEAEIIQSVIPSQT